MLTGPGRAGDESSIRTARRDRELARPAALASGRLSRHSAFAFSRALRQRPAGTRSADRSPVGIFAAPGRLPPRPPHNLSRTLPEESLGAARATRAAARLARDPSRAAPRASATRRTRSGWRRCELEPGRQRARARRAGATRALGRRALRPVLEPLRTRCSATRASSRRRRRRPPAGGAPPRVALAATPIRPPSFNPRYSFEQFIIGDGNRLAHAAALAVAEHPGQAYNPLFLYAPPGLGKTHLLHAIGNYVLAFGGGARVRYTTAESFTNHFIAALNAQSLERFKHAYRDADVLLIDDVQFLASKAKTEEEFFHTFNALYETGRQLVLTCDRLPRASTTIEQRLRERFEAGLVAEISRRTTRRGSRSSASAPRSTASQLADPEVLELIAERVTDNIRALEGALIRVVAFHSLTGRPIDSSSRPRSSTPSTRAGDAGPPVDRRRSRRRRRATSAHGRRSSSPPAGPPGSPGRARSRSTSRASSPAASLHGDRRGLRRPQPRHRAARLQARLRALQQRSTTADELAALTRSHAAGAKPTAAVDRLLLVPACNNFAAQCGRSRTSPQPSIRPMTSNSLLRYSS